MSPAPTRYLAMRATRAFTLVEVLVSLALVALILPVVMKGISLATSAAVLARERTEAASLAESKLSEIIATGAWQDEANLSGDFSPDWPEYRWTGMAQAREGTSLWDVQVSVQWTFRGSERSVTLSTIAYTGA